MAQNNHLTLQVEGMHCAGCVASIEKNVNKLSGVAGCHVNLTTRSAVVTYDPAGLNQKSIIDQIQELGFQASVKTSDLLEDNAREVALAKRHFLVALLMSVPLMAVAMWPMFADGRFVSPVVDGIIQAVLAAGVLFYSGRSILHDAFVQARHIRANMNTLIAMGTLAAFGWSLWVLYEAIQGVGPEYYFDSAGMIITIILLGRYFEARTKGRAGEALESLLKLRPMEATAIVDGVEQTMPVTNITRDMLIQVKPGERIPADGVIVEDGAVIDESMLTGESMPVEKSVGDEVFGGSVNGNVPFKLKVTHAGEDSYLNQIIRLVAQAQGRKAPVQRLADKVAGIFAPTVIALALITLAIWWWVAPESPMMIKSVVSVLIIACPCALGLATPTAILTGSGWAARNGIIIKGGDVIEKISHLNSVIFDKTGTLTHGALSVISVLPFEGWSELKVLSVVAGAESQSEHPVARAIDRYVKQASIEPASIRNIEARPGFGLIAKYDGSRVVIGNRTLLEREHINLGEAGKVARDEMAKGRTVVFVAVDEVVVGLLTLSDRLRENAREVIGELKDLGLNVSMISGDNHATAAGVANSAGIDSFEAEILPEQKQVIIESFRRAGNNVAMVGDGINDAPALAEASIGVAIGSGTDVALETADAVLVRSELNQVPRLIRLARSTMKVIRQNLFWAFFYNIIAIPIAAGLLYPVFGWTLSPMIAAVTMAFSSVFVVSNSLRLSHLRMP